MDYVKIGSYNYQERPNPFTVCLGLDPTGRFLHQIIEDNDVPSSMKLGEAVELENANTIEFGEENNVSISYDEPKTIRINNVEYFVSLQDMDFEDGRHALQSNAYFFDPADKVFRIVQFGIVPVSKDEWDKNGARYTKYVSSSIRRLLSGMNAGPDGLKLPIRPFSETK